MVYSIFPSAIPTAVETLPITERVPQIGSLYPEFSDAFSPPITISDMEPPVLTMGTAFLEPSLPPHNLSLIPRKIPLINTIDSPNSLFTIIVFLFLNEYSLFSLVHGWLWWDLNLRPWAYESPALTTELQSPCNRIDYTIISFKKYINFYFSEN